MARFLAEHGAAGAAEEVVGAEEFVGSAADEGSYDAEVAGRCTVADSSWLHPDASENNDESVNITRRVTYVRH